MRAYVRGQPAGEAVRTVLLTAYCSRPTHIPAKKYAQYYLLLTTCYIQEAQTRPAGDAAAPLSAEHKAALLETMQKHTLSLVWTLTKRDIEATVRLTTYYSLLTTHYSLLNTYYGRAHGAPPNEYTPLACRCAPPSITSSRRTSGAPA